MNNYLSKTIALLTLWVGLSCGVSDNAAAQQRPNVLFIMTDDHAQQALHAYGHSLLDTVLFPNLDRIANEGAIFMQSFVTNSICAPSRAVLLTGKYSHINGKIDNSGPFDWDQPMYPKLLQKAGYQTALIGKIHLSGIPQGYDYSMTLPGQGSYYNPEFIKNGTEQTNFEGHCESIIPQLVVDWIENDWDRSKPFAVNFHTKAPHRNWMPERKYLDYLEDYEFEFPENFFDDYHGMGTAAREQEMEIVNDMYWGWDMKFKNNPFTGEPSRLSAPFSRMTEEQMEAWNSVYGPSNEKFLKEKPEGRELAKFMYHRYLRDYLKTVKSVDDGIGKVLGYLEENGLLENTVVIYTSDQGFYLGEHGWFDKRFMYEQSLSTPLLVRYPQEIKPGTVVREMVLNLDLAPTILDYAGVEIPSDMQGKSWRSVAAGNKIPWRDAVYYHYYEYPGPHMVKRHYGVRTDRYKLIHFYYDVDEWELYDLQKDPDEMRNIYNDSAYSEVQKTLHLRLNELREQYGDSDELTQQFLERTQTSEPTEAVVFGKNDKADWIMDDRELPSTDSLFYADWPSPLFRKEFVLENEVKSATLYITAAGYYKATLNAHPVGKNVLDPAWTDYSKRVYYTEYDVTSSIISGTNCLGVSLGNGFYNPLPMRKWGRRNLRNDLKKVGNPAFIAKLVITCKDGKTQEIVTDNSWKFALGPLLQNDVYIGNIYDARKRILGWNTPGYDDTSWNFAERAESPGGELEKAFFPPVQVVKELTPVEIYSPEDGIFIVDMGVNFTGTYKIKLSGNRGDTVTFRFGERVYEDEKLNPMTTVAGQIKRKGMGGPGAPDIAWQTDSYIVGDTAKTWFTPEFTYHVYRYMEIAGLHKKPEMSDIKGLFIHSNVSNVNSFSCSSDLLNSIQKAVERTFLANLVSVQSDCPAREKFAYGGDLNATSESFIYNFDMQAFYRKTIYDWVDAMNDSIFVDTAPYTGIEYCGISWESAFLITQYYLYLYYNDTEIVRELYDLNREWMDKVVRIHPESIVDKGLSDHESMEPVPVQLTGTSHYLQCALIMREFAAVMGDSKSETKYEMLADTLKNLIKAEFWDQPVAGEINRQTLFSTLLYHGIVPSDEVGAANDSLMNAVRNGPSGHFSTGIFGTKYILEALSEYHSPLEVYNIVNSKVYPGWGFMIDKGATTIWETWKESDNTYSNCHPMFGTVTEWFYRWLAGIRPDPENPGFKKFILGPSTPQGLEFVNCTYYSPFGKIISNWKKVQPGTIEYEITIPAESSANVILQTNHSQKISIRSKDKSFNAEKIKGLQSGNFELGEGEYLITVSSKE